MDTNQGPMFSGPIFPHGSHDKDPTPSQLLQGRIVGVRSGRRGEESTQILTIQLTEADLDASKLLHSIVDLFVNPQS